MSRLVRTQLAQMGPDHNRVRVAPGDNLVLKPDAAEVFAMTIHELTTNAVKHGAVANGTGSVRFGCAVDSSLDTLSLCWQERDGPSANPPSRQALGSVVLTIC